MPIRSFAVATIGLASFLAAGCGMRPFGNDEPRPAARPKPLVAAPSGSVVAKPLPPPAPIAAPPTAVEPAPAGPPPAAPEAAATSTAPAPMQTAEATPALAGGETQVGRTDLLGGWKINSAGQQCQLFMTLTTWSGGYRASTKGCGNPALQKIAAWNMEGKQIQLINDGGVTVARLYPSSKTLFKGQTEGGGPVTVSR